MKRILLVAVLAATSACRHEAGARTASGTDFYSELAPYGTWSQLDPYGTVWQPSAAVVGDDFYPYYSAGWWDSTEAGWSWHSTFAWGWVPFHHGRWLNAPGRGWVWVPGDEWAPAWVEWRVGGGNVGWVPLAPSGVSSVYVDYHPRWCFVPLAVFPTHGFQRARLPAYREYAAYHAATAIPFERGDWRRGPSVDLVERAAGAHVRTHYEPQRRLRSGDVRAESRLGPQRTLPQAPNPMPAPSRNARPEAARERVPNMPPPPNAAAPANPSMGRRPPAGQPWVTPQTRPAQKPGKSAPRRPAR